MLTVEKYCICTVSMHHYLLNSNNSGQFIAVNTDQVLNNNDNNIELTNSIKYILFHKPHLFYTRRTGLKDEGKSSMEST
uniref:Uncharacterized protein n=1 Tax=Gracilaria firma TaxID=2510791 RepID=A0A1P8D659_9FLOR|nr:hypothetical protein [Gracilaria firma]APR74287.1 hypothetical protein [Gracilaria firma]